MIINTRGTVHVRPSYGSGFVFLFQLRVFVRAIDLLGVGTRPSRSLRPFLHVQLGARATVYFSRLISYGSESVCVSYVTNRRGKARGTATEMPFIKPDGLRDEREGILFENTRMNVTSTEPLRPYTAALDAGEKRI